MSGLVTVRIAALALLVGLPATPALAQEVGKASAVNPAATANLRTITIGSSITHKERIKTAAEGSVQILFVDKTSMTIGPNSDLTIDEYVYNPNAGTGKLAATLGKGALRFVGGQISHSGDAEIKTTNAVIGIRGGVALISQQNVYAGYGTSTVTSGDASVTLGAGEFTQTAGDQPPSPPAPPPPGFVAGMIQAFQSARGQTGGAPKGVASPANVARAESLATGSNGGAVAGSLTPPPPAVSQVVRVLGATTTASLNQTIQSSVQSVTAETVARDQRPAVALTGFFGGLDRWVLGSNVNSTTANGDVQMTLDRQNNRVQAAFSKMTVDVYNPRTVNETAPYGSADLSQPPNSNYASYEDFTATIPDNIKDSEGHRLTGTLRSVSRATAIQIATANGVPNLTICECDYTRWGVLEFQVDGRMKDSLSGYWVAGRPTTIAEIPAVGRATYIGHVVANAQDISIDPNRNGVIVGDQRLVGGNFTNTVDFGARSGAVTVTGLDRTNYAGTVSFLSSDPRRFAGSLAGDSGNRRMDLSGSFFRGTKSPVGEMGGAVTLSSTNYIGSGIFAARMK